MEEIDAFEPSLYPGSRILVVDGDPAASSAVCDDLERMGHVPVALASAEATLETLEEARPDLIVTATELPGLDGFALCRSLKGHSRWQDLPLLLLATCDALETRVRGLDCGADDVLVKPPSPAELRARIDRSLDANERTRTAAESERALTRVVLDTERALSTLLADPGDPRSGVRDVAHTILDRGPAEDRPEGILFHRHDDDPADAGRWEFFWRGGDGSLRSAEVPAGGAPCSAQRLPDAPWALQDLSWSNRAGGHFSKELEGRLGGVRSFVRAPVFGGCVTAFNLVGKARRLDAQRIQGSAAHALHLDAVAARVRETETAFLFVLETLARLCEGGSAQAAAHVRRLNALSALLAETLGMDRSFVRALSYSAQLHDVGKIKIPPHLLSKAGPLTVDEFDVVKTHTLRGAGILGGHPSLSMAREIALAHHERWDGTGYPEGRVGETTPLSARIVALADIYDALRTEQPYREAQDHDTTRDIITRGDWKTSPEHFDPAVLAAFVKVEGQFVERFETLRDPEPA